MESVVNGVLVVGELKNGQVRGASREAVSAGRQAADAMGGAVHVAVCGGPGSGEAASGLGQQGATVIHGIESSDFQTYHGSAFAVSLADLIRHEGYEVVLLSATAQGRDLAPRLAAHLGVPLLTDATGLDPSGGDLAVTRPVYAGKAIARVRSEGTPVVVSLRPNAFAPVETAVTAEVRVTSPDGRPEWGGYRPGAFEASGDALVDVSEASVIVSGGRGMKGPEHWGVLGDLRDALASSGSAGAVALGASRAVVDAGWRPHGEQVGQTGKTVAPKLYFALGISGAIQHLAGMKTSQVIVAVNKDPDAPIFGVADYGIVGDVFEVVPALAQEVRALGGA